jgi:Fic family protein
MTDQIMDDLLASIASKKAELDLLRPMSRDALRELQRYYDVELTYTSNAIEGNTLTHRETAEVIEHGITAGGKKLRDHLEALDHNDALLRMRHLADHLQEPLIAKSIRSACIPWIRNRNPVYQRLMLQCWFRLSHRQAHSLQAKTGRSLSNPLIS